MEYLDVVNGKDEVVGTAPRDEVYQKNLPHRIVHVLIFNSKGEIALQLRSNNISYCPGHWATTACGHVHAGETYEAAARRELQEEVGVDVPITLFSKDWYKAPNVKGLKMFLAAFRGDFSGLFAVNPREVQKVEFFTLSKIQGMIRKGEKIHPESLFVVNKYFAGTS